MVTTNRSLSWIDRTKWGELLGAAVGDSPIAPPTLPTERIKPTRRTLRPPHMGAAAAVPSFLPPESQLDERLSAFLTWVVARTGCSAVFVADEGGLPVAEHSGSNEARIAAVSAVLAMLQQFRQTVGESTGAWVSVHFGDNVIHFVEVKSDWGRFGAGLVTRDSLPSKDLVEVRDALARAFVPTPRPGFESRSFP